MMKKRIPHNASKFLYPPRLFLQLGSRGGGLLPLQYVQIQRCTCQNIGFFLSFNTRREGTNHHECIITRTEQKRTKNTNSGARAHDSSREYPGVCNTCACVCVCELTTTNAIHNNSTFPRSSHHQHDHQRSNLTKDCMWSFSSLSTREAQDIHQRSISIIGRSSTDSQDLHTSPSML